MLVAHGASGDGVVIAVDGGSFRRWSFFSLLFFSSSVFSLPLSTMFLPSLQWLRGGVAGGDGGGVTVALLLSSAFFPLLCFPLLFLSFFAYVSLFFTVVLPFLYLFFFHSSSLLCISNNSSFPLFLYISSPCLSLSLGIYKEEKGERGLLPLSSQEQGQGGRATTGQSPATLVSSAFSSWQFKGCGCCRFFRSCEREGEREKAGKKRIKKSSSPLPLHLQGKKKQHRTVHNDIVLCSILFFLLFFSVGKK